MQSVRLALSRKCGVRKFQEGTGELRNAELWIFKFGRRSAPSLPRKRTPRETFHVFRARHFALFRDFTPKNVEHTKPLIFRAFYA